jgi:integrase
VAPSPNSDKPQRRRRDRGDDGIWWDRANHHYVGAVSLGFNGDGKRNRPTVRGQTRAEVKEKLDKLHDELNAGIHIPATYTVEQCVKDWFASIERDEHTMQTLTGQARKWIYPRIGTTKLKDFSATDAVKFFQQIAPFLSKRTLVMIKSTLRRSIRRAQVHDLIGRNVIELIDLPAGKPGRPSRAMTQDQAAKVLKTATGGPTAYVKVVKASSGRYGATHAATESGQLACGTKSHWKAPITELGRDLKDATCLSCRTQLGLDGTGNANQRLVALFVLSITLGLRPGELRMLTWDYVDFDGEWSTSGARRARPATPRPRSRSDRSCSRSARSRPSRLTGPCRTASAGRRARRGRTSIWSSATRTARCTRRVDSTGVSAR